MEALSAFATGSWTAGDVQLMCSHLPGKQYDQLTYEPLKTWSLRYSSGGGGAGRSASGGPQGTP
jgi:2'-5' RNA ligase